MGQTEADLQRTINAWMLERWDELQDMARDALARKWPGDSLPQRLSRMATALAQVLRDRFEAWLAARGAGVPALVETYDWLQFAGSWFYIHQGREIILLSDMPADQTIEPLCLRAPADFDFPPAERR